MTAAEWLGCEDARKMVEWLRGLASDRKLRLFACAFWRWHEKAAGTDSEIASEMLQALDYAEQWAERGSRPAVRFPTGFGWHPLVARNAIDAANWTIRQTAGFKARRDYLRADARCGTQAAEQQISLLREIVGNPFCPVAVDPAWLVWNDGTMPKVAQAIYDERTFDRLPILADALEEAGCNDGVILSHCRQPGEHVRGCWVVDLMLGRA